MGHIASLISLMDAELALRFFMRQRGVTSNRITTAGFEYRAAGNQVRALIPGGNGSQRYRYDAANRLVQVRTDDNNTIIASYTCGDSNERLIVEEGGVRTYYACDGMRNMSRAERTRFHNRQRAMSISATVCFRRSRRTAVKQRNIITRIDWAQES